MQKQRAMAGNSPAAERSLSSLKGLARAASRANAREYIAHAFGRVEDAMYIGLGLLLAASAVILLGTTGWDFWHHLVGGTLPEQIIHVLDRLLLIVIIVEILYTVQVSFREHVLAAEPFLIVGLIAATRRLLLLTADLQKLAELGESAFRNGMLELALLTVMIVALVASLVMLRRWKTQAVAERA